MQAAHSREPKSIPEPAISDLSRAGWEPQGMRNRPVRASREPLGSVDALWEWGLEAAHYSDARKRS